MRLAGAVSGWAWGSQIVQYSADRPGTPLKAKGPSGLFLGFTHPLRLQHHPTAKQRKLLGGLSGICLLGSTRRTATAGIDALLVGGFTRRLERIEIENAAGSGNALEQTDRGGVNSPRTWLRRYMWCSMKNIYLTSWNQTKEKAFSRNDELKDSKSDNSKRSLLLCGRLWHRAWRGWGDSFGVTPWRCRPGRFFFELEKKTTVNGGIRY